MEELILGASEREELEALRKEKRQGEMRRAAVESLEKYGISAEFARFMVGETAEATEENVRAFTAIYGKINVKKPVETAKESSRPVIKAHRGVRRV